MPNQLMSSLMLRRDETVVEMFHILGPKLRSNKFVGQQAGYWRDYLWEVFLGTGTGRLELAVYGL